MIRSDVVRKELTAGASENIYTEAWTERTYADMLARAEQLFWEGRRVLIDANFRDDAWRRRFLDAARRWCVPAIFLHCQADPALIEQRLAARRHDASDADWKVYQALESTWQPLSEEVRRVTIELNTTRDVQDCAKDALAALAESRLWKPS
jgi:predicted kinase